jgi:hypothetical protein
LTLPALAGTTKIVKRRIERCIVVNGTYKLYLVNLRVRQAAADYDVNAGLLFSAPMPAKSAERIRL